MRAAVPAPTPVLLGYADRFSAQAGDTLRFMVSCEAPSSDLRLVRLIHGDNNPDGPGYRDVLVPSEADGSYPGKHQVIAAGSYIRVPVPAALDLSRGLTVQAWVWPTMPAKAQAILAGPDGSFFFGLDLDGRLCLEIGAGSKVVFAGGGLHPWQWAFVAAKYYVTTREVRIYQESIETRHEAHGAPRPPLMPAQGDLLIAARALDLYGRPQAVFNGKIDRPKLFDRALGPDEIEGLRHADAPLPRGVLAAWDFSKGIAD